MICQWVISPSKLLVYRRVNPIISRYFPFQIIFQIYPLEFGGRGWGSQNVEGLNHPSTTEWLEAPYKMVLKGIFAEIKQKHKFVIFKSHLMLFPLSVFVPCRLMYKPHLTSNLNMHWLGAVENL